MAIGRFLCGITALLHHPASNTYLVLRRAAKRDAGSGAWEAVTGRVEQGESFEAAMHREVREELGVAVTPDFIIGTAHFYRGAACPENELLAVQYACSLDDRDAIRVSDEHSEARWLTATEIFALLPPEHWLCHAISRAEQTRRALPAALLATYRAEGFEQR